VLLCIDQRSLKCSSQGKKALAVHTHGMDIQELWIRCLQNLATFVVKMSAMLLAQGMRTVVQEERRTGNRSAIHEHPSHSHPSWSRILLSSCSMSDCLENELQAKVSSLPATSRRQHLGMDYHRGEACAARLLAVFWSNLQVSGRVYLKSTILELVFVISHPSHQDCCQNLDVCTVVGNLPSVAAQAPRKKNSTSISQNHRLKLVS
jgi:hypothetical protein